MIMDGHCKMCNKSFLWENAIKRNNEDDVKSLMNQNFTVRDHHLVIALKYRSNSIVQILLDAGANPNAVSKDRTFFYFEKVLCIAIRVRNEEAIRMLIKAGAFLDISKQTSSNKIYYTEQIPLIVALLSNYLVGVKILLDFHVCLSVETLGGITPMIAASLSGNSNAVKVLLHSGILANSANAFGTTALMAIANAINYGVDCKTYGKLLKISRILLLAGANINQGDDDNRTPLFYACYSKIYTPTPIEISHILGFITFLLNVGSNIHQVSTSGRTALMSAMSRMDNVGPAIGKLLCEAGSNVNATDCGGDTALFCIRKVINSGLLIPKVQYVNFLISVGVDVNIKNNRGQSYFHTLELPWHYRNHTKRNYLVPKILIYSQAHIDPIFLKRLVLGAANNSRQLMKLDLSYLCREVIRKTVMSYNPNLLTIVGKLGLPPLLTSFILDNPSHIWSKLTTDQTEKTYILESCKPTFSTVGTDMELTHNFDCCNTAAAAAAAAVINYDDIDDDDDDDDYDDYDDNVNDKVEDNNKSDLASYLTKPVNFYYHQRQVDLASDENLDEHMNGNIW